MAKILVVEDEENIRETLSDILKAHHYEVIQAGNGLVGLIKTVKEKPDLIISDIQMPQLNGFEMLEGLYGCLDEELIPPFIFLTAKVERKNMRKGMNMGADDYITKPFKNQEILEAIRFKLKKRAAEKERIVDNERKKVSRYLHDGIQNLLLASFLGFRSIGKKISVLDEPDQTVFKSALGMLDEAIHDLRDYTRNIGQNEQIDDIDSRLQHLTTAIKETTNLNLNTNISMLQKPSPEIQTHLYRIIQEALNNVLKHAKASEASIKLQCHENEINLEITDNGIGFDTSLEHNGMGLADLKKKAELIGADLKIDSTLGEGTSLHLHLPVSD